MAGKFRFFEGIDNKTGGGDIVCALDGYDVPSLETLYDGVSGIRIAVRNGNEMSGRFGDGFTFTLFDYAVRPLKTTTGGYGFDLSGTTGTAYLQGGAYGDFLKGGSAADNLFGEGGNDRLFGGKGADLLAGGAAKDRLHGGQGSDILSGGLGKDHLYGGKGADVFVFGEGDTSAKRSKADTIHDFEKKDSFELLGIDANVHKPYDQAFKFIGTNPFHEKAGELRYVKEKSDTWIMGDTDGDGKADFAIHLKGAFTLTADHFEL